MPQLIARRTSDFLTRAPRAAV